jgi:hypothetical protein
MTKKEMKKLEKGYEGKFAKDLFRKTEDIPKYIPDEQVYTYINRKHITKKKKIWKFEVWSNGYGGTIQANKKGGIIYTPYIY